MLSRIGRVTECSKPWLLVAASVLVLAGCSTDSEEAPALNNPEDGGGQGGIGTLDGGGAGGDLGQGAAPSADASTDVGMDRATTDAAAHPDASPAPLDVGMDRATTDAATPPDVGTVVVDAWLGSVDTASGCSIQVAGPFGARSARSAGYLGTLTSYSELYNVACTDVAACVTSCAAAGGTMQSCRLGSECVDGSSGMHCLPPTYWRYEDRALDADGQAAEQTLVKIDYQDSLFLSDFGAMVPGDATIVGIKFEVLRSASDAESAVDYEVRVLRAGQPVGIDHKLTGSWPTKLTYVSYGGSSDSWGIAWTPDDVSNAWFGLSLAAAYTDTAGNSRAYVDYARVSIYYVQGC